MKVLAVLLALFPWALVIIIGVILFRTQELLECNEKRLLVLAGKCDDLRSKSIKYAQDILDITEDPCHDMRSIYLIQSIINRTEKFNEELYR